MKAASPEDLNRILFLLGQSNLPLSGVSEIVTDFKVVRHESEVIAAGAIERHGKNGLLRSLVVDSSHRGKGLGEKVVSALLEDQNEDVYLLTETAEPFFVRFGFARVSREEAPPELRASEEFRSLCPESAAFMRRSVGAAVRKS
ncbi:MAG: arsenic resistance N-acetyltransferase ArsN2 [Bacteroidetes bacterium]|nr:arsenic resistance N-acetyltransferase ArsN2 [Bacteroidota bacterium]